MDDQVAVGQLQVQNLQEVASGVRSNAQTLCRFMFMVDIEEGDGVRPCVANLVDRQPMPVGRLGDLGFA